MLLSDIKPTDMPHLKKALEEKKKKHNDYHKDYYKTNHEKIKKKRRDLRHYRMKDRLEIERLILNTQEYIKHIDENTQAIMNILNKMA